MSTDNRQPEETSPGEYNSQLFTLRVWPEVVDDGRTEWRGKVQHVTRREARYFRDWDTMLAFLMETLDSPPAKEEHKEGE